MDYYAAAGSMAMVSSGERVDEGKVQVLSKCKNQVVDV